MPQSSSVCEDGGLARITSVEGAGSRLGMRTRLTVPRPRPRAGAAQAHLGSRRASAPHVAFTAMVESIEVWPASVSTRCMLRGVRGGEYRRELNRRKLARVVRLDDGGW
ncbi:MAG: hypothetical protein SFW67_36620 [Myxococcaceae bacterium]|nr:hypothetical protein [Myxococcaceae bacterium]